MKDISRRDAIYGLASLSSDPKNFLKLLTEIPKSGHYSMDPEQDEVAVEIIIKTILKAQDHGDIRSIISFNSLSEEELNLIKNSDLIGFILDAHSYILVKLINFEIKNGLDPKKSDKIGRLVASYSKLVENILFSVNEDDESMEV